MGKGAATRQVVVDEALRQAVAVGLDGLSLGVLAASAGLSKSGLFAHFKSKQALQLAVLDETALRFRRAVVDPALACPPGVERLAILFERYLDWMGSGCLFSVVAQELDKLSPPVAAEFVAGQQRWTKTIERVALDAAGPDADGGELTFELIGLALAYQRATKVFHDPAARQRAVGIFARRLEAEATP